MSLSISIATLRPNAVGVNRARSAAGESAPCCAASSAEKSANKSAGSCSNADVYDITVTAIETRPTIGISGCSVINGLAVSPVASAIVVAVIRVAIRIPAAIVAPVPAALSTCRDRQHDGQNEQNDKPNQKLLHEIFSFLLRISKWREKCAKFLERDKFGGIDRINIATAVLDCKS